MHEPVVAPDNSSPSTELASSPVRAADPAPAERAHSPTAQWGAVHLLAVLVFVAAAWAARELIVPVLIGLFLSLIANPLVGRLERLHMPRWIGAFFVVFGAVAVLVTVGSQLVEPASTWVQQAPQELRQIAPKLKTLVRRVDEANRAAASIVSAAGASGNAHAPAPASAPMTAPSLWTLLRATPGAIAVFGAIILLGYFFVVFGIRLQRQSIALLPDWQQKFVTAEILLTIENELSRYVLAITCINVVLALLLTLVLWQLGMDLRSALLWGVMVGLLNYAPYLGPLVSVVTLAIVGVVAFETPSRMFLPAVLYMVLQVLEYKLITPAVLGRHWSISPLVVLLWLLFCGWLWGTAGVLLAVPMLVSFKILAERIEGLNGWAKVIG